MPTPEMQALIRDGETLNKEKQLYTRNLSEILSKVPEEIKKDHKSFISSYFRAQLRIAKGQRKRAAEILNGLDRKTGFAEFEEEHASLLAAIDIAVRGSSNRKDSLGEPLTPLFRL